MHILRWSLARGADRVDRIRSAGVGMILRRRTVVAASLLAPFAATRARAHGEPPPVPGPLRVQRLSWAGVRFESGDTTLLADPWISAAAFGARWTRPVVPVTTATSLRYVLISNVLNDHYDRAAVRAALGDRGRVVCSAEIAPVVAGDGFRVWPMRLWEPAIFGSGAGEFVVTAVPSSDGFSEHQVMWVIKAGGRTLLHGGDVMWHAHWWRIGRQLGPFDIAFLPINGVVFRGRPPHVNEPRTLTPEQTVAACVALGARRLCPIHYGFDDPPDYAESADALVRAKRAAASRGVTLSALDEGAWLDWQLV
jgi:L-ascorbate metabolism protein UlaG (beta-lactamase superfamily)